MKCAIVTGGTKGIGKEIAINLLKRGYFVYLTYAHDDAILETLNIEIEQISKSFKIVKVDQANVEAIHWFTNYIMSENHHVDCIVCNAGATLRKSAWDIEDEEWLSVMNVSLNSHFYLIRDLHEIITSGSRIIFIGSLLGVYPHATSLPYGVSKAAVHALAKNLVKEFEGTGTTVNVIAPGFVETEWQREKPQHIRDNIINKTAVKRFATTAEIAQAAMFCVDNAFMNGSVIEVTGGYCFK